MKNLKQNVQVFSVLSFTQFFLYLLLVNGILESFEAEQLSCC